MCIAGFADRDRSVGRMVETYYRLEEPIL